MGTRISVIVPIYNVEPYLAACLRSLLRQAHSDLDVVMVDDGSTDSSASIATEFAERDGRFRLVSQANAGLGAARNTGVAHATGDFLAFLDSDDVLPDDALALLHRSLGWSESDFATGVVRRFGRRGTARATLTPFRRTVRGTHITEHNDLLVDRIVTNKLWRRSFWETQALEFPAGVLYEDIRVAMTAHVEAKRVDVLRDTVYWWRIRDTGPSSITQNRAIPQGIIDRVDAVRSVAELMGARGMDELRRRFDAITLTDDLRLFVNAADEGDEAYRQTLVEQTRSYLDHVDAKALDEITAINRLKYHLLSRGMVDELLETLSFERLCLRDARTVTAEGEHYGVYPFFDDDRAAVPRDVYRLGTELIARAHLTDASWEKGRLLIQGAAFIDHVDVGSPRERTIRLRLRNEANGSELELPTRHRRDAEVTTRAGQGAHRYDGAGFVAALDPSTLAPATEPQAFRVSVEVESGGLLRETEVWSSQPDLALQLDRHTMDGGWVVRPALDGDSLLINVERAVATIRGVETSEEGVQIRGRMRIDPAARPWLVAVRRAGGQHRQRLATWGQDKQGRERFTCNLRVADLAALVTADEDETAEAEERTDGIVWQLRLRADGADEAPLWVPPDFVPVVAVFGGFEYVVGRSRHQNLTITQRVPHPNIDTVRWDPGAGLVLFGSFAVPDGDVSMRLRRRRTGIEQQVSGSVRDGALSVTLPVGTLRRLRTGAWELIAEGYRDTDIGALPLAWTGSREGLPFGHVDGSRRYTLERVRRDQVVLTVGPATAVSRFEQRADVARAASRARRRRLQDVVVVSSWGGRLLGGDPWAIAGALGAAAGPPAVWVTADGMQLEPGMAAVERDSSEHLGLLGKARWIVTDHLLPRWWEPRKGQRVLQTWHGLPLRRSGFDLPAATAAARPLWRRELQRQRDMWTLVTSPSPAGTAVLRATLGGAGEIVEIGAPRADVHHAAQREERAAATRTQLGIAPGQRVVLWVPSARDEGWTGRRRRTPGVDLDFPGRDNGTVVLVHDHPSYTEAVHAGAARNVTGLVAMPLLLDVADVLVTDCSSLLLDFLHTQRPVVLYVPDVDRLRPLGNAVFEQVLAQPPGPIATDAPAALAAIEAAVAAGAEPNAGYSSLLATYGGPQDGRAAQRAVELLLGS